MKVVPPQTQKTETELGLDSEVKSDENLKFTEQEFKNIPELVPFFFLEKNNVVDLRNVKLVRYGKEVVSLQTGTIYHQSKSNKNEYEPINSIHRPALYPSEAKRFYLQMILTQHLFPKVEKKIL